MNNINDLTEQIKQEYERLKTVVALIEDSQNNTHKVSEQLIEFKEVSQQIEGAFSEFENRLTKIDSDLNKLMFQASNNEHINQKIRLLEKDTSLTKLNMEGYRISLDKINNDLAVFREQQEHIMGTTTSYVLNYKTLTDMFNTMNTEILDLRSQKINSVNELRLQLQGIQSSLKKNKKLMLSLVIIVVSVVVISIISLIKVFA